MSDTGKPSLTPIEMVETFTRHNELAKYPNEQTRAIIRHYTECTAIAIQAHKLMDITGTSAGQFDSNAQEILNRMAGKIRESHRKCLGIELSWEEKSWDSK